MPELLRRLASSIETSAPTTSDPAAPGKQTRTADLPSSAAPSQSAVSRVKAYAGETVKDGGGYAYVVRDDGTFEVTGAPPASAHSIGRVIGPEGKLARPWMALAQILFARRPARAAAVAAPATDLTAAAPAPALEPARDTSILPSIGPILDAIEEATAPIGRFFSGLFGDDAPAPANAPAPASAPAPAVAAEPAVQAAPRTELDANLVAASKLAATMNVPHMWDKPNEEGDLRSTDRRNAIVKGETKSLKTVICSEFTMLTLQKAGIDLSQRYQDPKTGLPVAWHKDNGRLSFADLYKVTNNQIDAVSAILTAQHGGAEKIEPGSARAKEIKSTETAPFLFVPSLSTVMAPEVGDSFGAGATAISLGGVAVDQKDRRPGDLQQRYAMKTGTTGADGHSSQIWKVQGRGVAYLGAAGSPTLVPMPDVEIPEGWYAVDGVAWEIGPDTNPGKVASFEVEKVQLIEANRSATDATGLSKMKDADPAYDAKAKSSDLTSTGRLPTSKWLGWSPSTPAVKGTIKPGGL